MYEVMERFLWKRFVHQVKPAISNNIKQAAAEHADEISFKTIHCSHFLLQKLHQFKEKGKRGISSYWTSRKEMHIKLFK